MDYGLKNHVKSVTMGKEKICTICTLWLNLCGGNHVVFGFNAVCFIF